MAIVWDSFTGIDRTPENAILIGTVGGFAVSNILGSGDGYDLGQDIRDNPPSSPNPPLEDHLVFARIIVEVELPLPITSTYEGVPPAYKLGIITVAAAPGYITHRVNLSYPNQFIGYYDPLIGETFPTGLRLCSPLPVTGQTSVVQRSHINVGLPARLDPGGVFYFFSKVGTRIRIKAAITITPLGSSSERGIHLKNNPFTI